MHSCHHFPDLPVLFVLLVFAMVLVNADWSNCCHFSFGHHCRMLANVPTMIFCQKLVMFFLVQNFFISVKKMPYLLPKYSSINIQFCKTFLKSTYLVNRKVHMKYLDT